MRKLPNDAFLRPYLYYLARCDNFAYWEEVMFWNLWIIRIFQSSDSPELWHGIWTTCTRQVHILLSSKKLKSHFHNLIKSNSTCSWQKATIKWHSIALSLYPNWTLSYSGKQVKITWRLRFQLRHSDQKGQCMAEINNTGKCSTFCPHWLR